jgi:hypothetical protein
LMSGKKSLSEKSSSESVMKMKPVVAQSAPKKPYRRSPVHDHKRWGFGGLLFQLAVHAARWDGEDLDQRKDSEPSGCTLFVCVLLERGDLSFIGTQEEANELRWKRKRTDRRRGNNIHVHYSITFQLLQPFKLHSCRGNHVASRHDGRQRRSARVGALLSCSYHKWSSLPYKEVQNSLTSKVGLNLYPTLCLT